MYPGASDKRPTRHRRRRDRMPAMRPRRSARERDRGVVRRAAALPAPHGRRGRAGEGRDPRSAGGGAESDDRLAAACAPATYRSSLRRECASRRAPRARSTAATNPPASTEVARVRKSAAPRADISPDGLPPMPRPPPSDRCIRMTVTSAAAMMAWTTSRKTNMGAGSMANGWLPGIRRGGQHRRAINRRGFCANVMPST